MNALVGCAVTAHADGMMVGMTETWTQPLISVDVVPLRYRPETVEVVLGRRAFEPFAGELALPGVLMQRERSIDAADRALGSKVGIEADQVVIRDVGIEDAPERDPRGPTLSIVKVAAVAPGATPESGEGVPLAEAVGLPFDHDALIRLAARRLLELLWSDREVTEAFFGEAFTSRDAFLAQEQLAAAAGVERTPPLRNLRRRIEELGWAAPTGETRESTARGGRPTLVWAWTRD